MKKQSSKQKHAHTNNIRFASRTYCIRHGNIFPPHCYWQLISNSTVLGTLEEDWSFLAAKTIPDPAASKPEDWVDSETMDDPEDSKPESWDQPEFVADPEAKRPEDWDEEMDGEWAAAKINNPEYKGEWKPRQIKNPAYKVTIR